MLSGWITTRPLLSLLATWFAILVATLKSCARYKRRSNDIEMNILYEFELTAATYRALLHPGHRWGVRRLGRLGEAYLESQPPGGPRLLESYLLVAHALLNSM